MEAEYKLGELITQIKEDILSLIGLKIQLLKLETAEKTSVAGSFFIFAVIIINLALFALLFVFVALGFLFSDWVGSLAGGFAVVGAIYILIMALMFVFRESICTALQNLLLKALNPELGKETK
ncbi:hypothetical protein FACS18947_6400 [Bacteroidia bacterium]|nr:hypothetical protein FACS18947_6400 [Bacteroidia bacterium]